MSKKKRTKKHDPNKRARRFFSNVRIWSWESTVASEGERFANAECKTGMIWRHLSQKHVNGIVARTHNWVVCCRALCRLKGDVWVESEIRSARNIRVNDLAEEFDRMRIEVLNSVQLAHVVDVGWIIQSFHENDRIDDLIEIAHQGEVTEERAKAWAKSNETYHTRESRIDYTEEAA